MSKEVIKNEQRNVSNRAGEQLIDEGNADIANGDIYISTDDALFKFDLPGVSKGDVKIEVDEDNNLIIRAENSHIEPCEPSVSEFNIGNYYRSFKLSKDYDKNAISAAIESGVLTVTVPKKEEAKPHKIEINA